jgi:hypothetical protein
MGQVLDARRRDVISIHVPLVTLATRKAETNWPAFASHRSAQHTPALGKAPLFKNTDRNFSRRARLSVKQ